MAALYDGLGNRTFRVGQAVVPGTVVSAAPTPTPTSTAADEPATDAAEPAEEESMFWYGFWQGMVQFIAGPNQAVGGESSQWLERGWAEVSSGKEDDKDDGKEDPPPPWWEQPQDAAPVMPG